MKKIVSYGIRLLIWGLIFGTLGKTAYHHRARILGLCFEWPIENSLTQLFSMKMDVDGLRVDPLTGDFSCARMALMNQKEFSPRPHIEFRNLRGTVQLGELKKHHVWIPLLTAGQMDYLMERILLPDGDRRTNSRMMAWAAKEYVKSKRMNIPVKTSKSAPWTVEINRFTIEDGSFTFDQKIPGEKLLLSFHDLHGGIDGFRFPTPDQVMSHYGRLEGHFGKGDSVRVVVEGPGNYGTNNVSFRLKGVIDEGPILGYEYFWKTLPVEVLDGRFQLRLEAGYRDGFLDAKNFIVLTSLKLKAGDKISEKLSGTTLKTLIKFMESKESIELDIPMHGDITDPTFEASRAFREAFQEAIKKFATGGLEQLKDGTTKIAAGTGSIAVKTTGKIFQGVEAVTETVVTKTPVVSEIIAPVNPIKTAETQEGKASEEKTAV